ncbi:hypothetical protein VTO42DRAFT_171 [Malbranchea cinnamomea]
MRPFFPAAHGEMGKEKYISCWLHRQLRPFHLFKPNILVRISSTILRTPDTLPIQCSRVLQISGLPPGASVPGWSNVSGLPYLLIRQEDCQGIRSMAEVSADAAMMFGMGRKTVREAG